MRNIFLRVVFFLILVAQLCGAAGNFTNATQPNFTNSTNASISTNSSIYSNVTTPLTTLYIGAFFDLESKNGYGNLPIAQQAFEEVNNNKDILPGYRLELVPISTQGHFGFGQKAFHDFLSTGPHKIMLLGPGENSLATSIAAYAGIPEVGLLQFSYGTSDLELASRRDLHPNFFRTTTSVASLDAPRIEFVKAYGWHEVGIIYGDSVDYLKLSNQLATRLKRNNINVLAEVRLQENDPTRAIRTIKDQGIHVILGMFPFDTSARKMFCEAYRQKMYGPHYVWMLVNSGNSDWWIPKKNEEIACSEFEMNCQIQNHFSFYHTKVIHSKKRFYSHANKSRIQIIDEYKARVENNNGTSNKTTNFLDVYDAAWSIAFVLDQSRTELFNMQGKVLENLTYGDANATVLFRRNAVNLNFPSPNIGLSVRYYTNGDRKNAILLKQLVIIDGKFKMISGGKFDVDTKLFTKSDGVHWFAGTPYTRTTEDFSYRTIDRNLFIGLVVLAALGIVYALFCLFMLVLNFKKKIICNSGPLISLLIIIGCILNYVTVLLYGFDYSLVSTDVVTRFCRARSWTFAIGFTLSVGGLTAKLWIAYTVLKERLIRSRNNMLFWMLAMLVALFVIDIVILACWEGKDPLYRTLKHVRSQPEYKCFQPITADTFRAEIEVVEHCDCTYLILWLALILTFKVLLLLTGAFLAWQTRRVYIPSLNDTQHCASCMLVVVLLCLVGSIVAFTTTMYPNVFYGVIGVFIIVATTLILLLLFVNKIARLTCRRRRRRTVRTVDTQNTNSKYLCGASLAKFFSFCACSVASCVSCSTCFLCCGLYSCLRKIFFGSGSHTYPDDGGGEESKADFYIGGVPQDKSTEIARLRNELREKNTQLSNLGHKRTVKSIWTQTMDDREKDVWNPYDSDFVMSDSNASDVEGGQGTDASRRFRRAANKVKIFNQPTDYSHVQSKVNTGIRRTSIAGYQQTGRGSRVSDNFLTDEERRRFKATLAMKDEEIEKLRKELERAKIRHLDVKTQPSSSSKDLYPTMQRIILVETPPTPIPPESTTTAQQLPVTAMPNKQEPSRRKSIDAACKKPKTDDKTQDRSNEKSSVASPAENRAKKQSISRRKTSFNGSKSEDESERSREASPGSSPGSERSKKAENRKNDIKSPVSKDSNNAGPRASLTEVTLSELPAKTNKSGTPPRAAGDVERESQGQAGCEDKSGEDNVKQKQAHRKISSWLFEDNENENKNKPQTGKDNEKKKMDEADKGEKKQEENGVGTSKDEDKKNTTSNKIKREREGRKDSLPSGRSNNTKDKVEGEGNSGNMKDKSVNDNFLQQGRGGKDDRRRSVEIMSVEGEDDDEDYNDGDDDDFDNEADQEDGSSENGGNSPRSTTKAKATNRGSRKGRGRRRKITFSKLNWNVQSKIDSGSGNYKPRKSDVRIPNFKTNYSHVKSRVPSLKESNTTDNAARDKEPYRRRSLSVNKIPLPQYSDVRPRLYDGIAKKYDSDIPDSIP